MHNDPAPQYHAKLLYGTGSNTELRKDMLSSLVCMLSLCQQVCQGWDKGTPPAPTNEEGIESMDSISMDEICANKHRK